MVSPIEPVQVQGLNATVGSAGPRERASDTEAGGFADAVGEALSAVGRQETEVRRAAEAAAVGDLRSVSDYMIAATEAQLATEITVAVRDRAISAFNEIMRMQI